MGDARRNFGGLTEQERVVYHLRESEGLTFTAIGERLGITRQSSQNRFKSAKARVDEGLAGGLKMDDLVPAESTKALTASRAGDSAVDLRRAAKSAGLSPQLVNSILKRATKSVGDGGRKLKEVNNNHLIALCEDRISMAFDYMDDAVMASASAAALATTAAILIDKRQLLKGAPTSILAIEDRRKLSELGDALLEEVNRRKKTIDVTPVEVVEP